MAKIRLFDKDHGTYEFKCPAGHYHYIRTIEGPDGGHAWKFNGDLDKPTFSPSILERCGNHVQPGCDETGEHSYLCHFHLVNGVMQFCGDCSHDLKNQHIELPEIEPRS